MSDAGGANNSFGASPAEWVYCTGSTDSQFEIRMYTKSVTASGNTNGAIRMPIAVSIWSRIWTVIASKNNCTPPGTPVEVTLERRKNASPMTMTAASADDATVSTLTVMPNQRAGSWWPPSSAASAKNASVIGVAAPFQRERQHHD